MGACLALGMCECAACIACSCCQSVLNGMLGQAARFGHVLVIATIFILSAVLGTQYPQNVSQYRDYTEVNLSEGCEPAYENTCIYRQLMYRASFALFVLFCLLAVGTLYSDKLNKSMWPFKFGIATAMFVGFWWAKNGFFEGWAEFARAVSFIWLMFQGLLLIDFGHDCHDAIMAKAEECEKEEENGGRHWLVFYLLLSCGFLCLAGTGLAYLFMNYSGCSLGMFFIMVTLIFGVITTILSLLNQINKGFLTPCIMFAYSVFMCWYALLSSPNESCNPTALDNEGHQWRVSIGVLISISTVVLMYCVCNGTVIMNIFDPNGVGVMQSYQTSNPNLTKSLTPPKPAAAAPAGGSNSPSPTENTGLGTTEIAAPEETGAKRTTSGATVVEEESGTPKERMFFHILMVFFIIYATMMLTNWGKVNGNVPAAGSHVVSNESMWFKIISQWTFIAMYCRILQLAYSENKQ